MKRSLFLILLCRLGISQVQAQDNRTTSMFLGIEHNFVLSNPTRLANPSLSGVSFQMYFNRRRQFQPILSISEIGDLSVNHSKANAVDSHGQNVATLGRVVNLFTGMAYLPSRRLFFSLVAGPTFLQKETLFGVKPSIGMHFGKFRRFSTQVSYMKVSRSRLNTAQKLQTLGLSVAVRLY